MQKKKEFLTFSSSLFYLVYYGIMWVFSEVVAAYNALSGTVFHFTFQNNWILIT